MLDRLIDQTRAACRDVLASSSLRLVVDAARQAGVDARASVALVQDVTESLESRAPIRQLRERLFGSSSDGGELLERALLLQAALASLDHLPRTPVSNQVKGLCCEEFAFMAAPPASAAARFRLDRNSFVALCKVATLRRFPAGQLHWELSGLPRSWLLRVDPRALPRVWFYVAAKLGGCAPAFFIHLNMNRRDRFALLERESNRSYFRMAQSLALQPRVKGLVASSWLHSPDTMRVSPHLTSLNRVFLEHGALVTTMGPAAPDCGVFERSPERRRLYEHGAFRPTTGLVIWPRDAMLRWADTHPEYGD